MSNTEDLSILADLDDLKEFMGQDKDYTSKAVCACLMNKDYAFIMYNDGTKFELERI